MLISIAGWEGGGLGEALAYLSAASFLTIPSASAKTYAANILKSCIERKVGRLEKQ